MNTLIILISVAFAVELLLWGGDRPPYSRVSYSRTRSGNRHHTNTEMPGR